MHLAKKGPSGALELGCIQNIKITRMAKQRLFSRLLRKEGIQEGFVKHHMRDGTGSATKSPCRRLTHGLGEHMKLREAGGAVISP